MWARAAVLGCAVLTTGAVSHVAAGGLLPGPTALLALLGLATAAGALFLHRAASAARLVVLVVSGQAAVHLALSGLAGHRGDPAGRSTPGDLGLEAHAFAATVDEGEHRVGSLADQWEAAHASASATDAEAAADGVRHLVEHAAGQGPAMLLAHVGGAVALALWLAVGERALWHLVHLAAHRRQVRGAVARAVAAWTAAPVAPRLPRPPLAVVTLAAPPLGRRACRVVVRRGPPLLVG